jgi:hypothetical protein
MPPPQLAPFSRLGYYTYYRQGTRRRARRKCAPSVPVALLEGVPVDKLQVQGV